MPLAFWIIDVSATISNHFCIRKMLAFKALLTQLSSVHTAVLFLYRDCRSLRNSGWFRGRYGPWFWNLFSGLTSGLNNLCAFGKPVPLYLGFYFNININIYKGVIFSSLGTTFLAYTTFCSKTTWISSLCSRHCLLLDIVVLCHEHTVALDFITVQCGEHHWRYWANMDSWWHSRHHSSTNKLKVLSLVTQIYHPPLNIRQCHGDETGPSPRPEVSSKARVRIRSGDCQAHSEGQGMAKVKRGIQPTGWDLDQDAV